VVLVGAVWIASLTHTIVTPVITAAIIASVMSPLVSWMQRHGVPRGVAAALLLLGLVVAGVAVTLVVVGGVSGESSALQGHLSQARQTITGWLTGLGVQPDQAQRADQDAAAAISKALPALLHGVSRGIAGLSSLAVFLSFTALSLFFMLKDGATIRAWGERHMGLPAPLARAVSGRSLQSLRGYFFGVTIVAVFNAVVVGAARWYWAFRWSERLRWSRSSAPTSPTSAPGVPERFPSWSLWAAAGPTRPRHGDHPAPGERRPPAARAADRLRGGAGDPPPGRADRDDRRWRPVRRGRSHPCGAGHRRSDAHLGRPAASASR